MKNELRPPLLLRSVVWPAAVFIIFDRVQQMTETENNIITIIQYCTGVLLVFGTRMNVYTPRAHISLLTIFW